MACNALKRGSFHLFRHPKWSRIIFGKTHFGPIFDPFLVAKQPNFKAFGDFRRAKTGHHELKMRPKHLFWHSMWSKIVFEKCHFFCTRWTTSCSLPRYGYGYGGLGVGWGNFEGWKPPKVGGCGWIRCARNRVSSHVAQDMVYFWFGAVGGQCAQSLGILGAFWGRLRTSCGVRGL